MKILTKSQHNEYMNQLKAQKQRNSDLELYYQFEIQEYEFKLEEVISKLQELDNMLKQPIAKTKCRAKIKQIINFIKYNKEVNND